MMKRFLLALGLVTLLLPSASAGAINAFESCSGANAATAVCKAQKTEKDRGNQLMKNIVNTLMLILGVVSTIMIVIGGLRYATSNGDSNQIQAAKNTILYAVIGLVVAILASVIVSFVIDQFA